MRGVWLIGVGLAMLAGVWLLGREAEPPSAPRRPTAPQTPPGPGKEAPVTQPPGPRSPRDPIGQPEDPAGRHPDAAKAEGTDNPIVLASQTLVVLDRRTKLPIEGVHVQAWAPGTGQCPSWPSRLGLMGRMGEPGNPDLQGTTDRVGRCRINRLNTDCKYTYTLDQDWYRRKATKEGLRPDGIERVLYLDPLGKLILQVDWPPQPPHAKFSKELTVRFLNQAAKTDFWVSTCDSTHMITSPRTVTIPCPPKGRYRVEVCLSAVRGNESTPLCQGHSETFVVAPEGPTRVAVRLTPVLSLRGVVAIPPAPTSRTAAPYDRVAWHRILIHHPGSKNPHQIGHTKSAFRLAPLPTREGCILVEIPGKRARLVPFSIPAGQYTLDLGDIALPNTPGRISGLLHGAGGRKALVLFQLRGCKLKRWHTTVDNRGAFDLAGLPWGTWDLYAFVGGTSPPLALGREKVLATLILTPQSPRLRVNLIHQPPRPNR